MTQLTLIGEVGVAVDRVRATGALSGYRMRPMTAADAPAIGALYFAAYRPGVACESAEEALADIDASFEGAYGEFWCEASPLIEQGGEIVAAAMTVVCAPWDDTPDCPFLIELFTDPGHRRRGLAGALLGSVARTLCDAGGTHLALRVAPDNRAALSLYRRLGFAPFAG